MTRGICQDILDLASQQDAMVATAESCTGGMVAAALTDIAGSSAVVDRGFVTYSNAAKAEMLAVDPGLIKQHGAVSEDVVCAMASGALAQIGHGGNRIAVSISGVAGPGGGTAEKPVGLVWFGLATRFGNRLGIIAEKMIFEGGRDDVRKAACHHALMMIRSALQDPTRG